MGGGAPVPGGGGRNSILFGCGLKGKGISCGCGGGGIIIGGCCCCCCWGCGGIEGGRKLGISFTLGRGGGILAGLKGGGSTTLVGGALCGLNGGGSTNALDVSSSLDVSSAPVCWLASNFSIETSPGRGRVQNLVV